jgi:hypothetical protein
MSFTSADIYPLAQRLHACIPLALRRWSGFPADPDERDRLANTLLMELTEGPEAPWPDPDEETFTQAVIIAEALAGFVTQWGCRYGNLDEVVDRAQAALVTALGGTVLEPGVYALAEGTPITVVAIAHLIGWVCVLDVEES